MRIKVLGEVVRPYKGALTLWADMWPLSGVCKDVCFQMLWHEKCLVTLLAPVRPVATVSAPVLAQVPRITVAPVALRTRIGLFPRVPTDMFGQIAWLCEACTAFFTAVRSLACVCALVVGEVLNAVESLAADSADIRPLTVVSSKVLLQNVGPGKCFPALVTLVDPFLVVCQEVHFQVAQCCKRFLAIHTREWLFAGVNAPM